MGKQETLPRLAGNYLSRLALAEDRRHHPRRLCSFPAKLLFTRHGNRGIVCHPVTVVDLSEGGARLIDPLAAEVPGYFYLCFGDFEITVGCGAASVRGATIGARFIRNQSSRLIDYLARERQAGETDRLADFRIAVVHH